MPLGETETAIKSEDAQRFGPVVTALRDGRLTTIRLLTSADAEALVDFYASVPPDDYLFYCPHALDRQHALDKAADVDNPRFVCLVAEDSGEIIAGYAWYRWDSDDSPTSHFGICLRREFQNAGMGRQLMVRLLEIAARIGPAVMCLTVQKANLRGVALYQKMGFQIIREQLRQRDQLPEYYMERRTR
jgi:ribosomal protein S18 acetylase RimI-like enzyme